MPILEIPGTAEAFIDLIRSAPVIRAETIWLADLLRTRTPRQIRTTARSLTWWPRPDYCGRPPTSPGMLGCRRKYRGRCWPCWRPGPTPAHRDAATDALLTLLVAPSRLKDAGRSMYRPNAYPGYER